MKWKGTDKDLDRQDADPNPTKDADPTYTKHQLNDIGE
jgi:hypothetical protein